MTQKWNPIQPTFVHNVFVELSSGSHVMVEDGYATKEEAVKAALAFAERVRDRGPDALHVALSGTVFMAPHVCAVFSEGSLVGQEEPYRDYIGVVPVRL